MAIVKVVEPIPLMINHLSGYFFCFHVIDLYKMVGITYNEYW